MSGIPGDDVLGEVATADVAESKADAFKRLAIPRVENILERLRILGNLSDKSRYEYTPEQIVKIEAAILETTEATMKRFRGKEKKEGFTL